MILYIKVSFAGSSELKWSASGNAHVNRLRGCAESYTLTQERLFSAVGVPFVIARVGRWLDEPNVLILFFVIELSHKRLSDL